jgi:hypothetical protein
MGEPMAMAILPDGSVLHDSRDGTVYYTQDGVTSVVAHLNVYTHDEDGLQGIAIDPQFAQVEYNRRDVRGGRGERSSPAAERTAQRRRAPDQVITTPGGNHAATDHPVHRPVGRPAVRGGLRARLRLGL